MEFSRQEYWSGLPFHSLGDFPDPGIKLRSPTLQVEALPPEPPGNPHFSKVLIKCMRGFADGCFQKEKKKELWVSEEHFLLSVGRFQCYWNLIVCVCVCVFSIQLSCTHSFSFYSLCIPLIYLHAVYSFLTILNNSVWRTLARIWDKWWPYFIWNRSTFSAFSA